MDKNIQHRALENFQSLEEDGARYLEGFIPYGKRSRRLPFYEIVERTAFNKTLADGYDVKALYNHDYGNILGRVKNGSLELRNCEDGLKVRCKLPQTRAAEDVWNLVNDGYLTNMSFGFTAVKTDYGYEDGVETHYLREVKLYEVSFVSEPAYLDTTACARSIRGIDLSTLETTLAKEQLEENDVASIREAIDKLQELLPKEEEKPAVEENTEVVKDTSDAQQEQQLLNELYKNLQALKK